MAVGSALLIYSVAILYVISIGLLLIGLITQQNFLIVLAGMLTIIIVLSKLYLSSTSSHKIK